MQPLTVGSNDKTCVNDLGRRLFISGVEPFQMHLIANGFSTSMHINELGHRGSAP